MIFKKKTCTLSEDYALHCFGGDDDDDDDDDSSSDGCSCTVAARGQTAGMAEMDW